MNICLAASYIYLFFIREKHGSSVGAAENKPALGGHASAQAGNAASVAPVGS